MQFSKTLILLLLGGGMAYSSSLLVYKNKTIYNYEAKSDFIGLTKDIKAKCNGHTLNLRMLTTCPTEKRLCKDLISLQSSEEKLNSIKANSKVLEKLISLPQPTSFDANSWVESARVVGKEQARLFEETKIINEELKLKQRAFQKQAPSKTPLATNNICKKEIELSIPYGYISFSTLYEANIENEKEIEVTQYISLVNRSGIDIKADKAMFYNRSLNQYVRAIHFTPWIVGKHEPHQNKRVVKRAMLKTMSTMSNAAVDDEVYLDASEPVVASYVDAREYKIENLSLPSTGLVVDVKVASWKSALSCKTEAFPYYNTKAFKVCSFIPKFQIEKNRWRVKSSEVTINENAVGEYRNEKYHIYTQIEEDIEIFRKPIVNKERQTGIFGGNKRKKDGFVLTITNKSSKVKTIKLTDRIPTSTTDEIKVKLLKVSSNKRVNYKVLKDGKIEMNLTLAANETKKIEVMFEISYDKDLKISY
jgi:hypothetical protein